MNNSPGLLFDKRAALLDINDYYISSRDLEEAGQFTLADARDGIIVDYTRMSYERRITRRNLVGHNDIKGSNLVFNQNSAGDLELTSVIDYEMAQPSTPEQELRRTPQMGEEVMMAAIDEYAKLTGRVLDPEVIRFWDRVHFVQWAMGATMQGFPNNSREILTRELTRIYPDWDWREVSGDIRYPNVQYEVYSKEKVLSS